MKKCPTCQKTYDDNLRFCQTDGTPLVEDAPPPDPYATMVASKDEIMSAMPPDDEPKETPPSSAAEDDDLLDIPEEGDSNKTVFVSDAERRDMFDEPSSQPIPPPSSFGQSDLPEEPKRSDADTLLAQPEPPKFNEPDLNPPSFGDISPASDSTPAPPASPFGSEPPTFDKQPLPSDFDAPKSDDSSSNAPIPSPFGEQMPPSYNAPSTPPFAPPEFKEEEIKAEQLNTPFAEEVSQGNQAVAESGWTPPAAPDQNWQNQEIGQNTPFQPPPAGNSGQSKTLAFVSLALGIVGFLGLIPALIIPLCGTPSILLGIGAIITGFLARSRSNSQPEAFGGGGLGLVGAILGVLCLIAPIAIFIFYYVLFNLIR